MNNESTIAGLRAMADWLEEHPEFPAIEVRTLELCYSKDELLRFTRELGAFEKKWTDSELEIIKRFSKTVMFHIVINREKFCTKRVIWECPDEGLLELAKEISQ